MNKEITLEELKEIEFEILQTIHSFCVQNDLRYYLCGGTLLGAVRHGGFIPWDDDIDICMPREDYEKFISSFTHVPGYTMLSFPQSEGYFLPFIKVCDNRTLLKETIVKDIPNCGVFVDIFPLDGLSDDLDNATKILQKSNFLMKLNTEYVLREKTIGSIKHLIKRLVCMILPQKKVLSYLISCSKKYSFDTSVFVGVAFGFYGEREIMPKEIFSERVEIAFENSLFFAPLKYEQYLTTLYGDFMQPPPVEKRVTHHSFVAFWKEEYEYCSTAVRR